MAKRKRKRKIVDLDIVIPVYGRPDLLEKCLQSVDDTKGDIKINTIIVDDCGPEQDELSKIYKSLNGQSRVLKNKQNMGFPFTINRGLLSGNAPLILILNSDIELKPECLEIMMSEFDNEDIGVVGPKLLFPDSNDPSRPYGKVQHAGLAVNIKGQIIHANIGWSSDNPKVNERRSLQAVTGACLMTRRSVCKKIYSIYQTTKDPTSGPFNEVYSPGTYEDVEFCFAARSEGFEVVYTPKAEAYHWVGASVKQNQRGYPLQRNEMIFRARCGKLMLWDEWRYL